MTTLTDATRARRDHLIHEYYAATDAWDTRRFGEFLAENVAFRMGNADPIAGLAGVVTLADATRDALGGVRHDLSVIHHDEATDTAVVELDVEYTRLDGSTLRVPAGVAIHFDAVDKIDGYRVYVDLSDLFG